jgi:acyl carrier protein
MIKNFNEIKELVCESLEIKINEFADTDKLLKCPTWDSIGLLTIIANFKQKYNITLDGKHINILITFNDLFQYIITTIK